MNGVTGTNFFKGQIFSLPIGLNKALFSKHRSLPTVSYNKNESCLASHFDTFYPHIPKDISTKIMEHYRSDLYRLSRLQQVAVTEGMPAALDRIPLDMAMITSSLQSLPETILEYRALDAKEISNFIDDGYAVIVHHPMVFSRYQEKGRPPLFTPHHYAITSRATNGNWRVKNPGPNDSTLILKELTCLDEQLKFKKSFVTDRDITTVLGAAFVEKRAVSSFNRFMEPLGGRCLLPQYIIVKV
ncbi:hypothetical protein HOH45_07900 [bacterium]|jgi:hypothetical protein|nr:hypothetical protein [bacterium]